MRNILLVPFIVVALLLACAPQGPTGKVTDNTTLDTIDDIAPVETPDVLLEPEQPSVPGRYTVEATEGDLIELKPEALDPDGDELSYTFTEPFDNQGRWQTSIGDEGKYAVVVGVSDESSTTTETVDVVVLRANRAPIIECKDIVVNEGDFIDLHQRCSITDEDNAEIIVTYGGWMDSWRYQTDYDDAGTHIVTITASDKITEVRRGETIERTLHTVSKDVELTVKDTNRLPVFADSFPVELVATENDVITLPKEGVTDPDRDPVRITYSEPFDSNGVWRTEIGDAGTYQVDVVASDGKSTSKRTVSVNVGLLNTAPTLRRIPDITVKEGETVKLAISATDREGDELEVEITGWMDEESYKTTYEDAGNYSVKVTVSDGEFTASQVVQITVVDVNRPPVFVNPA